MSSLLEFHDLELTKYCATFSPSARDKLHFKQKEKRYSATEKTVTHSFSDFEINSSREDLSKLRERVGLLRTHCDEAIEQVSGCGNTYALRPLARPPLGPLKCPSRICVTQTPLGMIKVSLSTGVVAVCILHELPLI